MARKGLNSKENKRATGFVANATKDSITENNNSFENDNKEHTKETKIKQTNIKIKKTYNLDEKISKVLDIYSAMNSQNKSSVVEEALKSYIPEKYKNMVE